MEWLICGSVPDPDYGLTEDAWRPAGEAIVSDGGRRLDVRRGTPALIAAAALACGALSVPPPRALLCGDTGTGKGSALLYRTLAGRLRDPGAVPLGGITFHYLFPDLAGHDTVLMALDDYAAARPSPLLVADAGFMYVAKMSGYAARYDLFTPDAGELAFLADEKAPHPFYTRGFLLSEDNDVPDLVRRAYAADNAARHMIVKGATDYVVSGGAVEATVSEPSVPAMEPIGGTGDMVTGLCTAFLAQGRGVAEACVLAAKANRLVGEMARPTPATQVAELMRLIPEAVSRLVG